MNNVLGLDLSLTDSGVYFNNIELINMRSIKSKYQGVNRLREIKNTIKNILGNIKLNLIVIEGYGFSSQKGHSLGELGGVVKVMLKEEFPTVPILLVPPTVLKKFVTGKGNADKSQMLLQIYKKFGKEFSNHNIADAYGLYEFGKMYLSKDKTKMNLDLCNKIIIV